jgi:formylglycine-generating enzyme required for sulfatase activity
MAFAAWTGKRLPSEPEWEASARSTQGLIFPWGEEWVPHVCNTEDHAVSGTTAVDAFKDRASPLGMVDMLGNVLEWTTDIWNGGPQEHGTCHVAKGGSWISERTLCLYSRYKVHAGETSNILGFRCVAF